MKGFSYRGYRATVSRGAELVWPIEYHNPYGRSGARGWRLRLSVPVTPEGVEIAFEIE